jgi:histidine triad (HIT) family protein
MNKIDCIFCKIAKGEIPSEKIYEDGCCFAFLDINPVHEGHLLIVPKEHYSNMTETPDNIISAMFIKAKELMPAVQKGTVADFVVLTIVGTDVPHFHIHLIPRFKNDGLAGFWPAKKYENNERMKEVGDKIRKNLS